MALPPSPLIWQRGPGGAAAAATALIGDECQERLAESRQVRSSEHIVTLLPSCLARSARSARSAHSLPLSCVKRSDYFIATDPATGVPTELEPVAGSPEDFRVAYEIGERIDEFANTTKGYQTQAGTRWGWHAGCDGLHTACQQASAS